jgi:O-acetyl-ADP-ribose deacetylase (regulator of RNase III)
MAEAKEETEEIKNLRYVKGNIVFFKEEVLAHQTNCTTVRPHGLSQTIKTALGADSYGRRKPMKPGANCAIPEDRPIPGTYELVKTTRGQAPTGRFVVCLYAQHSPGKSGHYYRDHGVPDSKKDRLKYFETALSAFLQDHNPTSVAMPKLIGCGLAGGDPIQYKKMIETAAKQYPKTQFVLYDL